MRAYNLLFALSVLCIFSYCQYKKNESFSKEESHHPDGIDTLFIQYDSVDVFVSTYFINTYVSEKYIEEFYDDAKDDGMNYCALTHYIIKFYQNPIYLSEINERLTSKDVDLIKRWCSIDEKLNSISLSKDEWQGISFEELIYRMKGGTKFYKPYIKHKDQYYGSLDFDQVCHLYYDVLLFLTYADPDTENDFFSDYFKTFQKLTKERI